MCILGFNAFMKRIHPAVSTFKYCSTKKSIIIFHQHRWMGQIRAAALYRLKTRLASYLDQLMLVFDALCYAFLAARSVLVTYSVSDWVA